MNRGEHPGARVHSIDWLRGLSVALMIVAHCLIFLDPSHDGDRLRALFAEINGLPGPIFLMTAGFSLAYVLTLDAADPAKRAIRRRKSLKRIAQIFLASLLLRHVLWDGFRNPHTFLWVDTLTCIGLMLLATWGVLVLAPAGGRRAALILLAAAAFAVAPFVQAPKTFGLFTGLLNNGPHANTWPLVPWAGYGWGGAIVGLVAARSGGRSASLTASMFLSFGWLVMIGLTMSLAGPVIHRIDAGVSPYLLTNAGTRLWKLGLVGIALLTFERGGETPWPTLGWWINLLSRRALTAYVAHLLIIFGYWKFAPLKVFVGIVDWPGYAALTVVVLILTTAFCLFVERSQWRQQFRRDYLAITPARPS